MSGKTGSDRWHIGVLMAVYEGAALLPEQLASLAAQTHANWQLLASIDSGRDGSREVLERFGRGHAVTCLDGPGQGGAANFLHLIRHAGRYLPANALWAFSDQDDVWLPEKLARAADALTMAGAEDGSARPALYCSRSWITDSDLANRRLSPPRPKAPGFANALVQNIAQGTTIVLNPAAAALAEAAAARTGRVVVHDWWLYQIVTGAGGRIIHDDAPTLLYRQHAGNAIGANDSRRAQLWRLWLILRGTYRDWNETNIAALGAVGDLLTPANRAMLEEFDDLRRAPLAERWRRFRRLGLYRQSRASELMLWLALILNRL